MERYIICMNSDTNGNTGCMMNVLRNLGTSLANSVSSDQLNGLEIAKTLCVVKINVCFIKNTNCPKSQNEWKSFDYWAEYYDQLDTSFKDSADDSTICELGTDLRNVAEQLHNLADSLPHSGTFHLDILWNWPSSESIHTEDHLEYFAAMKRCVAWHNARVILIGEEFEAKAEDWLYFLNASVIKPDDDIDRIPLNCLWYGSVDLPKNDDVPEWSGCLPGFCLLYDKDDSLNTSIKPNTNDATTETEKVSLSPRMEFVSYCQLETVPSYAVQTGRLKLKTISDGGPMRPSQEWLTSVIQNNKVGVVLRLHYIADDWIPYFYNDFTPNTANWKKSLDDEDFNDVLPLLPPESSQHLFLLVGDSSKSISESSLYLLKDADMLNGLAAHHMRVESYLNSISFDEKSSRLIQQLLESLPCFSKSDFIRANKIVQDMQKEVIQAWITAEEDNCKKVSTAEEMQALLAFIRDETMKQLKIPFSYVDPDNRATNFCKARQEDVLQADHLVDPNDWPERISLLNREIAADKRKRVKTSDALASIFASSPDTSLHFSCADFLKCFSSVSTGKTNPSHLPEAETCTAKGNTTHSFQHLYYSDKELNSYPWPEVKELKFPDIYYNKDQTSEFMETASCQAKDKFITHETASTFVLAPVSELKFKHLTDAKKCNVMRKPLPQFSNSCKKTGTKLNTGNCIQSKKPSSHSVHARHAAASLKRTDRRTPKKVISGNLKSMSRKSHHQVLKHTPNKVKCGPTIVSPRRSPRVDANVTFSEKVNARSLKKDPVLSSPPRTVVSGEKMQDTVVSPRRTPKRYKTSKQSCVTPRRSPRRSSSTTPRKSPRQSSNATPRRSPKQSCSLTPRRSPRQSCSLPPRRSPRQDKSIAKKTRNYSESLGRHSSVPDSRKSPHAAVKDRRIAGVQRRRHGSGSSTSSYCELSQKHLGKLRGAVVDALEAQGVDAQHELYQVCGKKLIRICKAFALDVIGHGQTSVMMRQIADAHVKQVIDFEMRLGHRH